jgi:uncharacterized membrane protein YfcA
MSETWLIFIAIAGSLIAGFIDAVVGGGGLLQVPLLFILFPGMNHMQVIATNRFASFAGTLVAANKYRKKITISKKAILYAGVFATLASFGGVYVMRSIATEVFKPILFFIILGLLAYSLFYRQMGISENIRFGRPQIYYAVAVIGLVLGLYNGMIGPGTGTLLVFALVQFIGFDFLHASAYAKWINAIADGASLIAFLIQGSVIFKLALPMMVSNMLGAYIGSHLALKKGNSFIRTLFMVLLLVLIIRFAYEIF